MDQLPCNSHVDDQGWTIVMSRKRNRNQKPTDGSVPGKIVPNERWILTEKMVSADVEDESNGAGGASSKRQSNSYGNEGYDFDVSGEEIARWNENMKAEKTKKLKPKKEKETIVSLSEAAAKIDRLCLKSMLFESLKLNAGDPVTQLWRFIEYIRRELSEVRFPWLKTFPLEGPWPKLIDVIDVPLSDIPEPIYITSVNWINELPNSYLSSFVEFAFEAILTHLAAQQEGAKSGKIGEQSTSHEPHYVALFVTLAMVLRKKPNALTLTLEDLRQRPSRQGQDKLPLTVWMMAQASQGDLSVGLYSWACNLLPVVGHMNCSSQSMDLILQLVEKILSLPEARTKLMNQAVRKVRLIPPPLFEILLRLTFPASCARVQATERFEAIYPFLKEVALARAPNTKAMKQVTRQIFTMSWKLAGEGNPALAREAIAIAIWSVTENFDCSKQWDDLYKKNLEASVAVLKKLVDEWEDHSIKLLSKPRNTLTLTRVMKSFRLKNKKGITKGGANGSLYKEADKSCKVILGKLSRGSNCLKATTITAVVLAVAGAAAAVVLSSNPKAATELKNLVDSLELPLYINAITTAWKN